MDSRQLLFFTGATNFFHNFIPLYFLFGSLEHPGASFEFLVKDVPRMLALHGASLDRISELTGSSYYLHDVKSYPGKQVPLMQNSYRFLLQPFLRAEYVYIGDIDILMTENVLLRHASYLESGLPFYNHVRPGTKRLTGLHLARYDDLYPLHDHLWDYSQLNDEEILYLNYELRGDVLSPGLEELQAALGRPNCGVHLSLNRLPFSANVESPSWGIQAHDLKKLMLHIETEHVRSAIDLMYRGSRRVLLNIIVIAKGLAAMSRADQVEFLLKKKEIWVGS